MKFNNQQFARDIKVKRTIDNDWQLRDVEKKTGVSYSTLSRVENGKGETLDLILYAKICKWLGKPMETYFTK